MISLRPSHVPALFLDVLWAESSGVFVAFIIAYT